MSVESSLGNLDKKMDVMVQAMNSLAIDVALLNEKSHRPIDCEAMKAHTAEHDRRIRLFFWGIGGSATILGGLIVFIKLVA